MTRYLLDTNILSEVTKPKPSATLVAWLAEQEDHNLFVASWTLAEIRRGILELPAGKKQEALAAWFAGPDGPPALFAGRILPFEDRAASLWAQLMAEGKAKGTPRSALDMIIAATGLANGCTLVTANEKDFSGLPILNPLRSPVE